MVLAGAGSGKALTIAAKVKYLCEVKNINPNEILLVSFTKKSAQEMTERIQEKLGINAQATTFHKLGLEIIKNANGRRPEVLDENVLGDFIHNFFENELLNHPGLIKNLTEYFTYFLEIPENLEDYSSLGELYEEEKTADLETLKSKYEREKYIRETGSEKSKALRTLNNEQVKSIEETKIANFLFMHGIKYEYEKLYPYESDDSKEKRTDRIFIFAIMTFIWNILAFQKILQFPGFRLLKKKSILTEFYGSAIFIRKMAQS